MQAMFEKHRVFYYDLSLCHDYVTWSSNTAWIGGSYIRYQSKNTIFCRSQWWALISPSIIITKTTKRKLQKKKRLRTYIATNDLIELIHQNTFQWNGHDNNKVFIKSCQELTKLKLSRKYDAIKVLPNGRP